MRLFVALQIPDEIRQALASLIRETKPLDDSWKWTLAENLHITLKFLGQIAPEQLESVTQALGRVRGEFPLSVRFSGFGFFPNERRPRVLWVGLDAPSSLLRLAQSIEDLLAEIGIPREARGFTPHLTLARNERGRISETFQQLLAKYSATEFGAMNSSAFHLLESKLKSTGAEYTTLRSFEGTSNR